MNKKDFAESDLADDDDFPDDDDDDLLDDDDDFPEPPVIPGMVAVRPVRSAGNAAGKPGNRAPTNDLSSSPQININSDSNASIYDQLVSDVDVVRKFIPNKSREEILAYLEAHHADPNRVRIVISELLDLTGELPARPVQPSTSAQPSGISSTDEKVRSILELFPDADPDHLRRLVEQGDPGHVNATVNGWWESKTYPKLEEVQKAAAKRKFVESNLGIEEFLEMFPDPEKFFGDKKRVVTPLYRSHVEIYVSNQFRYAYKDDLTLIFLKHQYRLLPVMKALSAQWNVGPTDEPVTKRRRETVLKRRSKRPLQAMPKTVDELFYKEKFYFEAEEKIKKYKEDKENERKRRVEKGRKNGELLTCNCCFEDELLIEDMLRCSEGHLFCRTCIRRQAEVLIGQDKYVFPCLDPYCEHEVPLVILQKALPPNVFSGLVRKLQAEEIRKADIPDLVSCPFCTFCAIMPDMNNNIFKCLNPQCLKVSCRLCKELNHIPLRCEEIEKTPEVHFRTYIEDKMTEALLRTCPKCQRRFIKESGCNKMTCTCGQSFCYVCREPIKDYRHFEKGKCPQYSNDDELNRLEVQVGAVGARKEYIREHPEVEAIQLRHDPTKVELPTPARNGLNQKNGGAMPVIDGTGQIVFRQPPQQPRPQQQRARPAQQLPQEAQEALQLARQMLQALDQQQGQLRPNGRRAPPVALMPRLGNANMIVIRGLRQAQPEHDDDDGDEDAESESSDSVTDGDDDGMSEPSDGGDEEPSDESDDEAETCRTHFYSPNRSDEQDQEWNSCDDLSSDDDRTGSERDDWSSCHSYESDDYNSCGTGPNVDEVYFSEELSDDPD